MLKLFTFQFDSIQNPGLLHYEMLHSEGFSWMICNAVEYHYTHVQEI